MGLSACLSPSFHKHLEFLATSASAQNGSWWRWTTNQSSADTVARRTIRPGTCSIRYNTGLGILAPGSRGHCKPCLVLLGLPIWRREVVGHLGKMVNCGGGVGIHTPGWAREEGQQWWPGVLVLPMENEAQKTSTPSNGLIILPSNGNSGSISQAILKLGPRSTGNRTPKKAEGEGL